MQLAWKKNSSTKQQPLNNRKQQEILFMDDVTCSAIALLKTIKHLLVYPTILNIDVLLVLKYRRLVIIKFC